MAVYEDISGCTKAGSNSSKITLTTTRCTFTNSERTDQAYAYKDYGTSFFGNVRHDFDCGVTSVIHRTGGGIAIGVYAISNNPDTVADMSSGVGVYLNHLSGSNKNNMYIEDYEDNSTHSGGDLTTGSTYYMTFIRSGTTITCYIYNDSARTDLQTTLSTTCGTTKYRYLVVGYSCEAAGNINHDMCTISENYDIYTDAAVIESDNYTVGLDTVEQINFNTTRNVTTYVFSDDTDEILDEGKSIDQIILSGVLYEDHYDDVKTINDIIDAQEIVELKGLDDYYLNDEYMIIDFSFEQSAGEDAAGVYHYSITFEKLKDRLPFGGI